MECSPREWLGCFYKAAHYVCKRKVAMAESAFGSYSSAAVCMVLLLNHAAALTGVSGFRTRNFTATSAAEEAWESTSADTAGLLFPALVVFGDSTVDVGNNNFLNTIVRSDFAPYGMDLDGGQPTGRFTDGLLATDFISLKVGIPPQLPYLSPEAHGEAILTGVNFASAASGWFEDTSTRFNVKGLATQLEWCQNWKAEVLSIAGPEKGNYIIENALYAISTGSNDWVNNYYFNPTLLEQYNPDEYTTMLLGHARQYIQELYNLGGRNIVILNLPPLGCVPQQITLHGHGNQGCVKSLNDISNRFNKQLLALVEDMKTTMLGSRLILINLYTIIYNAFQNPQQFGFKYARVGCCGSGILETSILCNRDVPVCENPSEHLFWDSFHPTSHFYSQLADVTFSLAKPILLAPPHP